MFERTGSKSDPFFGIVVDPLRAIAKGRPEMGAFRNFPPEYKPTNKRMGPDGKVWPSEAAMTERWGPAAMSYYSMDIEFFQTTLSRRVLDVLAREHLWARVLASTTNLDRESRESTAHRVSNLAEQLARAETSVTLRRGSHMHGSGAGGPDAMTSVAKAAADVSAELLQGQAGQVVKYNVFARVGAGDEDDEDEDDAPHTGAASASSSSSSSSSSAAGK
jgi:COP9 signalosome complex subunit 5